MPHDLSFEGWDTQLQGDERAAFIGFVRSMLQWRPEDRKTPRELLDDPWLRGESVHEMRRVRSSTHE